MAALNSASDLAPAALLEQVHHALRSTRGAAVAIAQVETDKEQIRFAGAGNISAMIIDGSNLQHMISHNGTAGHNVRKFQEFLYPWTQQTDDSDAFGRYYYQLATGCVLRNNSTRSLFTGCGADS